MRNYIKVRDKKPETEKIIFDEKYPNYQHKIKVYFALTLVVCGGIIFEV